MRKITSEQTLRFKATLIAFGLILYMGVRTTISFSKIFGLPHHGETIIFHAVNHILPGHLFGPSRDLHEERLQELIPHLRELVQADHVERSSKLRSSENVRKLSSGSSDSHHGPVYALTRERCPANLRVRTAELCEAAAQRMGLMHQETVESSSRPVEDTQQSSMSTKNFDGETTSSSSIALAAANSGSHLLGGDDTKKHGGATTTGSTTSEASTTSSRRRRVRFRPLKLSPELPADLIPHAGCYYDQVQKKLYFQSESDLRDRSRSYTSYLAFCKIPHVVFAPLEIDKTTANKDEVLAQLMLQRSAPAILTTSSTAKDDTRSETLLSTTQNNKLHADGVGLQKTTKKFQPAGDDRVIWDGGAEEEDDEPLVLSYDESEHEGHILSECYYPILFVLAAVSVSILTQLIPSISHTLNKSTKNRDSCIIKLISPILRLFEKFPHSVVLYLAGLGMALFATKYPDLEFSQAIEETTNVDPKVIFWVLLPALLYEDSACTNWHVGRRVLPNSLLLALPGALLNTLLTGGIIIATFGVSSPLGQLIFGRTGIDVHQLSPNSAMTNMGWGGFSVMEAFLLGAILSATDPVAVIGALHDLQAPAKLTFLISGEALLNDGSGVLLFMVCLDLAKGSSIGPYQMLLKFLWLAVGGIVVGLVFFFVTLILLRSRGSKNASSGIFLVLCGAYGSFVFADHQDIEVSAVLAIVAFGFSMSAIGQFSINREEVEDHHTVIGFLACLSNELLFILGGVVGFRYSFQTGIGVRDWCELGMLYIFVHATRAIVVCVLYPFLKRSGYGMTFKESVILVFSGLRGAVGLAMAILVEADPSPDPLPLETRARIAFHVAGIALLTICINGSAITPLYNAIGVYESAKHHSLLLHRALCQTEILSRNQVEKMRRHWFFHNLSYDVLDLLIPQLDRIFKSDENAKVSTLLTHHGDNETANKAKISDKRISKLMLQLASILNIEKESRYRAKVDYASKYPSVRGLSLFLQREMINSTDLVKMDSRVATNNMMKSQMMPCHGENSREHPPEDRQSAGHQGPFQGLEINPNQGNANYASAMVSNANHPNAALNAMGADKSLTKDDLYDRMKDTIRRTSDGIELRDLTKSLANVRNVGLVGGHNGLTTEFAGANLIFPNNNNNNSTRGPNGLCNQVTSINPGGGAAVNHRGIYCPPLAPAAGGSRFGGAPKAGAGGLGLPLVDNNTVDQSVFNGANDSTAIGISNATARYKITHNNVNFDALHKIRGVSRDGIGSSVNQDNAYARNLPKIAKVSMSDLSKRQSNAVIQQIQQSNPSEQLPDILRVFSMSSGEEEKNAYNSSDVQRSSANKDARVQTKTIERSSAKRAQSEDIPPRASAPRGSSANKDCPPPPKNTLTGTIDFPIIFPGDLKNSKSPASDNSVIHFTSQPANLAETPQDDTPMNNRITTESKSQIELPATVVPVVVEKDTWDPQDAPKTGKPTISTIFDPSEPVVSETAEGTMNMIRAVAEVGRSTTEVGKTTGLPPKQKSDPFLDGQIGRASIPMPKGVLHNSFLVGEIGTTKASVNTSSPTLSDPYLAEDGRNSGDILRDVQRFTTMMMQQTEDKGWEEESSPPNAPPPIPQILNNARFSKALIQELKGVEGLPSDVQEKVVNCALKSIEEAKEDIQEMKNLNNINATMREKGDEGDCDESGKRRSSEKGILKFSDIIKSSESLGNLSGSKKTEKRSFDGNLPCTALRVSFTQGRQDNDDTKSDIDQSLLSRVETQLEPTNSMTIPLLEQEMAASRLLLANETDRKDLDQHHPRGRDTFTQDAGMFLTVSGIQNADTRIDPPAETRKQLLLRDHPLNSNTDGPRYAHTLDQGKEAMVPQISDGKRSALIEQTSTMLHRNTSPGKSKLQTSPVLGAMTSLGRRKSYTMSRHSEIEVILLNEENDAALAETGRVQYTRDSELICNNMMSHIDLRNPDLRNTVPHNMVDRVCPQNTGRRSIKFEDYPTPNNTECRSWHRSNGSSFHEQHSRFTESRARSNEIGLNNLLNDTNDNSRDDGRNQDGRNQESYIRRGDFYIREKYTGGNDRNTDVVSDNEENEIPRFHSLANVRQAISTDVRQAISSDVETEALLYETIFNAASAAYAQMYGQNIVSELAYRALLESFEYAKEAVEGELQPYVFLESSGFPDLHNQPHKVQTEASLEVFWDYLLYSLERGVGVRWKISKFLYKYLPAKLFLSESNLIANRWENMKRSFECIFSFIIVNETLIDELPVFEDVPHIKISLNHLLESAIAESLYLLHKSSPEMFIMLEHIVAARLLLINKKLLLEHLVEGGVMKEPDVRVIIDTVIEPSFQKLSDFVPTIQMMEIMRAFSNPNVPKLFAEPLQFPAGTSSGQGKMNRRTTCVF